MPEDVWAPPMRWKMGLGAPPGGGSGGLGLVKGVSAASEIGDADGVQAPPASEAEDGGGGGSSGLERVSGVSAASEVEDGNRWI